MLRWFKSTHSHHRRNEENQPLMADFFGLNIWLAGLGDSMETNWRQTKLGLPNIQFTLWLELALRARLI